MDNNVYIALQNLKDKTETTRSAHSYCAWFFGSISLIMKIIIIIGSTITTTLIFSNYSFLNNVTYILFDLKMDESIYIFIAGLISLIIFILSLTELVLSYGKRSERHDRAIKDLTTLVRDMKTANDIQKVDENLLTTFEKRYTEINESYPTIPDFLFVRSVQKYQRKRATVIELKENPFRRIWQINWHLLINYNEKKYK